MKIALSLNGKYVCAEQGGDDQGIVHINRPQVGPWETFLIWKLGDGFVALETDQHRFLSHATSVLTSLLANRCRKSDGQTHRPDLRTVADDVVSLPHDAWESFEWDALTRVYGVTIVEGGNSRAPHLEQRGNDFVDEHGERQVLNGLDGFFDLRIYRDGGEKALLPHLQQTHTLGFSVRRVWSQGSQAQNHGMDMSPTEPGYYESLRPYVLFNNAQGIIPLLTAFVDNQDVRSPREHFSRLAEAVRGTSCLLSGFNQWSKNRSDFGPDDVPDPGAGIIWSRGSDVDDTKTQPHGAPASELHSTRISFDRSLMDAAASPINMREHGSTMVWMTEGIPADQNSDPFQYWQLGRVYATCWALAIFHNRQTQAGQLMTDRILECARAWSRGMQIT